jgi:O-glycosyl hydrolase
MPKKFLFLISFVIVAICLFFAQAGMAATGTVNYTTVIQTLEGFGGAVYVDCDKLVAHSKKEEIYDLLFKELGLEVLRVRNSVGYDDAGVTAAATVVAAAKARKAHKVNLTPWSPPANLKSGGTVNGGTLKKVSGAYVYADYANWWANSLTTWSGKGVTVDYISMQNEPDYETTGYDSCKLTPTETTSYAGYNKAFKAVCDKLGASKPKMLAPDTMGFGGSKTYISALSSLGQLGNVYGYAHHLYGDGSYDNPDGMISGMQSYYNSYGSKPLFMTEYVKLNTTPNFDMGLKFAWHIYNCLYYEKVKGFYNWTLFRGYGTDKGGIVTMTSSSAYVIRPQYWFLKAYTHSTDAGWSVLSTSVSGTGATNLRMSAFKSPANDKLTVVILNKSTSSTSLTLTLNGFTPNTSTSKVYRSSQTENWKDLGTYSPSLTLPAQSITTLALVK